MISFGATRVLCTASVEEGVPGWKRGKGEGWLTAEYAMLPRATRTRTSRERAQLGGRTQEIQRLIGRSVRAMLDDFKFGEFTVKLDCDVLVADGGTRTAAITGACVAIVDAFAWMVDNGKLATTPVKRRVAAVSVGVIDGEPRLDWNVTWSGIVDPQPPFDDAPWKGGFMRWADANLPAEDAECAIVLRRATDIGMGRGMDLDSIPVATELPKAMVVNQTVEALEADGTAKAPPAASKPTPGPKAAPGKPARK